jgi:aspartate aminotransferase
MCAAYRRRHDFILEALNAIPGIDCRPGEGTFYAFPRVQEAIERLGLADDTALTEMLINEADVAWLTSPASREPLSVHPVICGFRSPAHRKCSKRP